MSSPTELYLPPIFPYPIKVVSLDVPSAVPISRGTRLLTYSFVYTPLGAKPIPETRFGTWDSATEGEVKSWRIKQGDIISERRAREKPVLLVAEPCKHGVQIGGLCGLCGKDMTDYDYTGFSDASRASIQMSHSARGPTVSLEEARKIEQETAQHLLKSRKLSLIVDLDQTIVHATVDPTVGEWIAEGEAWEARQAKATVGGKEGDSSDDDSSQSDDECNPNWGALKDVKKFRLGPESFGLPPPRKGMHKPGTNDGCMYYIKPRPGWKDFLHNITKKYEMHVYTMGTRAYAEEVCLAIDPDGKLFGGRLLSRDESGSLTQKSLQRLFPCDTSMVVIIDDRSDVWEWSPNLIKVIPYDFFVGIGDINSTFLPKVEALTASAPPPPSIGETQRCAGTSSRDADPMSLSTGNSPSTFFDDKSSEATLVDVESPDAGDVAERATKAILAQNSLALEAQLEQRPLAKKQEELSEAEAKLTESEVSVANDVKGEEGLSSEPRKPDKVGHKALLKNDDTELDRLSKLLEEVHSRFFKAYDSRLPEDKLKKASSSKYREPSLVRYDVTRIIPQLRSETLAGVRILFSSVIPLDTKPESTEIWRMAHIFGAKCYTELTNSITHVVAAKRGTVKVDAARKRGGIHIVWVAWFTDSIALWRRQDETPYLLDDPSVTVGPSSSPTADYHQISSDPDPDTDDWDETDGGNEPKPFELNEINWDDINDEVEAAMNESDDEDDATSDRSMRTGNGSEDEDSGNDDTNSASSTKAKRKRLRSLTPSEVKRNNRSDHDVLRSPLVKRRKLVAERSGYSKLKEAISADDLLEEPVDEASAEVVGTKLTPARIQEGVVEEGDDDDFDDDADDEDDFLARELGEEWG